MGKRGIHCHRDLGSPTFRFRRKYPLISTPASPLYCTGTRASSTPAHRHATPKRYRPTHRPSRRCPIHLNVSRLQGLLNRITTATTLYCTFTKRPYPRTFSDILTDRHTYIRTDTPAELPPDTHLHTHRHHLAGGSPSDSLWREMRGRAWDSPGAPKTVHHSRITKYMPVVWLIRRSGKTPPHVTKTNPPSYTAKQAWRWPRRG